MKEPQTVEGSLRLRRTRAMKRLAFSRRNLSTLRYSKSLAGWHGPTEASELVFTTH